MAEKNGNEPLVAVIMGSQSDWETMRHADETLTQFGVEHECRVISAHRSPSLAAEFGSTAESRGLEVVIAAAGGAAHLAGVLAAHTTLPVLGVPMKSDALNGLDSLLATVQMPGGIPVATLAIGKPGAINAALFAVAILAQVTPFTFAAHDVVFNEHQVALLEAFAARELPAGLCDDADIFMTHDDRDL